MRILQALYFPLVLATLGFSGCEERSADDYSPRFETHREQATSIYSFAIHPLHNPSRLHETYGPLVEYLNAHVSGFSIRLVASRNYASFDERLGSRVFDFALPNPYQTVQSLTKGYRVFGKMGDDENFRGIILVRRDGSIKNIKDLRGKSISYPAATALAATMMPQYFLQTHGLDVHGETVSRYVGSQESSIMNVYLGTTDAGATWPVPWAQFQQQRPELASRLEVKWQTPQLINNGLVVRDNVPAAVTAQLADQLFRLHQTAEGREVLSRIGISRFEAATGATFAPVVTFLADFTRLVRAPDNASAKR